MIEKGISDFGTLGTTVAATGGLQAALAGVSAVTAAGASAIMPPGSEGASILASVKQKGNVVGFINVLEQGIAEMGARNVVVSAASAEMTAVDAAGAAAQVGVDAASLF